MVSTTDRHGYQKRLLMSLGWDWHGLAAATSHSWSWLKAAFSGHQARLVFVEASMFRNRLPIFLYVKQPAGYRCVRVKVCTP